MNEAFSSLDYALALWRLGLNLLDVPRADGKHDGKIPTRPWKVYQTQRVTEAALCEWFLLEMNIAIITGAVSGIVVVDVDSPEAVAWVRCNLPRTPWRVRTARGQHLYYRHPGFPVRNRARIETKDGRLAIDVRGDGGFVIGPGSVHASGHVYRAEGDWSVPADKLPTFWLGWLERPRKVMQKTARPSSAQSRDIASRARAYLAAIPRPVIGQGSDDATFFAACRLLHGFHLTFGDAVSMLQDWAPADFDREWIETKVAAAQRYAEAGRDAAWAAQGASR